MRKRLKNVRETAEEKIYRALKEEKAWMKVLESRGREIKSKTKLKGKNWQKKYDNVPFLRGEKGEK
jgi:hypothetical protein